MDVFTPDLIKRVIYSKYLMKRATALQAKNNELSSAEALLAAHDSVEMLTQVVADHVEVTLPREFKQFWKVIKAKTNREPPREAAMDKLNHARVGFKHKGILPNPSIVSDALRNAVAFCEEISRDYLGLDFESVSLADVILVAEARDKIKEAERHSADGNFGQGIASLGIALDALMKDARERSGNALVGLIDVTGRAFVLDPAAMSLRFKLQKIAETVDMLILGIDVAPLRRFNQIAPIRQHAADGEVTIIWTRDETLLTAEDFDFCHAFIINFGLSAV